MPDASELAEFLQRAEKTTAEEFPEDVVQSGIFRQFLLWPLNWKELQLSLPEIQDAINTSSSLYQPVFSFLRYHDHARALRNSDLVEYGSRQSDPYEPLYVYWQVNRNGVVFQRSQQPQVAGIAVSMQEVAKYVVLAMDFAGHFAGALDQVQEIGYRIGVLARPGTHVDSGLGYTGTYPDNFSPTFESTSSVDGLVADPTDDVIRAVRDLMYQCGLTRVMPENLQQVVVLELTAARQRRSVSP